MKLEVEQLDQLLRDCKTKNVLILFAAILCFTLCANPTYAADDTEVSRFQQIIENEVLCDGDGTKEHYIKYLAEKIGMKEIIPLRLTEGYVTGYEGGFIEVEGTQPVEIFGFSLKAVYFEPEGVHFLALINADKEDAYKIVDSKYPLYKSKPIYYEYNPNKERRGHSGRHTEDGGGNSNRTIFFLLRPYGAAMPDFSIEIESCHDTRSKWFLEICNKFKQTPLTWMGCLWTPGEYYEERMKNGNGFLYPDRE